MKVLKIERVPGFVTHEYVRIQTIWSLLGLTNHKTVLRTPAGWYTFPGYKRLVYDADYDIAYDEFKMRELYGH